MLFSEEGGLPACIRRCTVFDGMACERRFEEGGRNEKQSLQELTAKVAASQERRNLPGLLYAPRPHFFPESSQEKSKGGGEVTLSICPVTRFPWQSPLPGSGSFAAAWRVEPAWEDISFSELN